MNYALIGCGRISTNHIIAVKNNNLKLVALCDVKQSAIDSLIEKHNLNTYELKKYIDYKKMIDENKLDLVSIATESGVHAEIALYCIKKKINVIIEKPMAMSMKDAQLIIDESKKNNVKVCVCHQNRFNLAVQQMRNALDEGRFGKISHASINVRWNRNQDYYKQAEWRGKWASDGGALMNQCIHGIDLLRWMLNDEIIEVYGLTSRQFHSYLEVEDIGVGILKTSSGAIGTIEGTVNVYPKNLEETLYLFGQNGTVKLGGKSCNEIEIWDFSNSKDNDENVKKLKEITSNVYGNGHTSLFADMIDAIENDREPLVNAIEGKNALEIVLAIYKSRKTGLPVKLPLDDFASEDMTGIFND